MGKVPGKVEVRLYVNPETKKLLQRIAIRAHSEGCFGRANISTAVEILVAEATAREYRHKAGNLPNHWNAQAEALQEKEHQRDIARKLASERVNARRRAAERSIRHIAPDDNP